MPNNISRSTAVAFILQHRQVNNGPSIAHGHGHGGVGAGSLGTRRKWNANLGLNHSKAPLISRTFSDGLGFGGMGAGLGLPISVVGRGGGSLDGFRGFGGAGLDASVNFGLGTSFGATSPIASAIGGGGGAEGAEDEIDFLLTVSSDEKLLTRLNEIDGSETVSTSGKGTDGKWRLECEEVVGVLRALQVAGERGNVGRVVWV